MAINNLNTKLYLLTLISYKKWNLLVKIIV